MVAQITTTLVTPDKSNRDAFSGQCDTFFGAMPALALEVNALSTEVNAGTVVSSTNTDEITSAAAFQGAWSAQIYAASKSVTHLNRMWKSNAITAAGDIPGTSTKWNLLTRNTGFKNFVINGNFVSWQRGTSGFVASGYAADMWALRNISAGACVCERVTKTDGRYGLRFARGTCSTAYQYVETRIELPQNLKGSIMNLSFKIKFRVASTAIYLAAAWVDGTVVYPGTTQLNKTDILNEQTFSASFAIPSDATDHSYFRLMFAGNAATGTTEYDFEISQVQLETGNGASDFEVRPKELEIEMCQRYYYRHVAASIGVQMGVGYHYSTTVSRLNFQFPVSMRIAPTGITQSGTAANYSVMQAATPVVCNAVPAFVSATTENCLVAFTVASGLTAGDGTHGRAEAITWIGFSAEL